MLRTLMEWRLLLPYLSVRELGRIKVAAPAEVAASEWWEVLRREHRFAALRRHRQSHSLVGKERVVSWDDEVTVQQLGLFLSLNE